MSKPLDIKITFADGSEQMIRAPKGQTLRLKAVANAKYQVIDAQSGQAPETLKAKRVGKDLRIKASEEGAAESEVVIENFTDTEGVSLIGQGGDGAFYEYAPEGVAEGAAALAEGREVFYVLSQTPFSSSALIGLPLIPQLATALAGAGVAAGVAITVATETPGSGDPVKAALSAIRNAAQLNNARPDTLSESIYAAAGVRGVSAANLGAMDSMLNSLLIDGPAVDSTAKIQALVDAMNAVLGGAGTGPAPTLQQLTLLGLQGVNANNLSAVQAAIRNTADDASGADSMDELQALIDNTLTALRNLAAIAQDNSATAFLPSVTDYAKLGITGVDASNLSSINSALNSETIDEGAFDTLEEIQALINAYKAVLAAADGQPGNPPALSFTQYGQLGLSGVNTPQKGSLLGQVIDGKSGAAVDSIGKLQKLADAVTALMNAAAGGTGPSLEQLQELGVTGVNPNNLEEVQKGIRGTADDGTGVDNLSELQALVTQAQAIKPPVATTGLAAITEAAQNDNATEGKPSVDDYTAAQVTGVDAGNLAAINSALNTAGVTGEKANTKEEVQELVNAYAKVLAAADGKDDNDAKPTRDDLALLGISGINSAAKENLLGQLLDTKTRADVDSITELQKLADAVSAVMAAAAGGGGPSLEQLQSLGLINLNPAKLAAVQAAIKTSPADGSGVDSVSELQNLVNGVSNAFSAIRNAAEDNSATETNPSAANYAKAGVSGVNADNIAAINSVLNGLAVEGVDVDTTAAIQAVVDAYKAVLAAADGNADNDSKPTAAQYASLGVTGVNTPQKEALLGQVIDAKPSAAVDTVPELQKLADAVAAVMAAAAGGTGPSLEQLQDLGVTGVNPNNLEEVQKGIRGTADDGTGVDNLSELQALVTQAQAIKPPVATTGLAAITEAAQNDNATEGKPSVTDYTAAQVTGVDAGNLAAINSALNTADVTGEKANTKEEVQELVNAYAKVLAAADGKDDNDAKPTAPEFTLLGITGMDTAPELSLLGDVLDIKTPADVDRVAELQKLADAVAAVIAGAAPNTPAPTLEQLQALGLTSVNPANLAAVQAAIRNTNDDGTGVDSLGELQNIVNGITQAFDAIRDAAQANTATETSPSVADYAKAGVSGVTPANLSAINSALNTSGVDGANVDTAPEIQALVDAYKAVLAAADGNADNDSKPTAAQYASLGVTGVNTPQKEALLGQVIDAKPSAAVDTVPELQKLADAVTALMNAAAGGTGPSLEQLQDLGVTGVNPNNLEEVQKGIRGTADDGTGVDNLSELQALVTQAQAIKPPVATTGLAAITEAAQNDNATEGKPSVTDYTAAQVTGVDAGNLAAINSALNTAGVTGEKANTKEEVQELVNAYAKVLAAADGKDDNDAKPTAPEFTLLGITGMDTAPELSLLGDVLDIKTPADVDRVAELQKLADAVAAVIAGAAPNTPAPSLEQLQALGLTGLNPANLLVVQDAIKNTPDDGSGVDSLAKLQNLVNGVAQALSAISDAAQANSATQTNPSAADYAKAGVSGVNADNLAAINSALNTASVEGGDVDTTPEIQALVNAYKAVLAAADGQSGNGAKLTQAQYELLGVSGISTPSSENLLGQVIDGKLKADVDTVGELQKLADAVAAVMAAAAGGTGPSLEQLQDLGVTGVNPNNLAEVQKAIRETADDGTGADSLPELQVLVSVAQAIKPPVATTGLAAITEAAQNDNATEGKPSVTDYTAAQVTGVDAGNLAAINSALNTADVTGEKANTKEEVQELVNAYAKVLAAADGKDDNDAKPTAPEFTLLGITGMDTAPELSLLGDVLDIKTPADVDRVAELQKLADAVAAVIAGAAPNTPAPTLEQLQALGLTSVNPANLAAVQAAIRNTNDDGTGVDSLGELQNIVNGITQAFDAIRDAAQANTATETSPSVADYAKAGVSGVTPANLSAINSALNTSGVDGANVDTAPEIQALVDAYKAVLAAADGNADNDSKPTAAQYASLGVTGVNTPQKEALLGQVIDAKPSAAVDTVPELQKLADAVAAVMAAAAGGTGPSLEQLQDLGVTGVNPNNLEEVQKGIRGTADDGTGVDNLSELQALVTQAQAIKPPVATTGLAAITEAAQNDNATEGKPSVTDYTAAQVTGVDAGNLAAINSALNTAGVTGEKANTKEEVQELVNAYAKVLAAADGKDDNDAKPTAPEFTLLGITGMDTAPELSLLGDVLDIKTPADVDRVAELQKLADAVAAVIAGAGPNTPAPSLEQLQALGLTGLNPANLLVVQDAIKNTPDDGSGVDSLAKLQNLVNGVAQALSAISDAAQANSATQTNPSAADYAKAGVSGVNADNLAAINSALNTASVEGGDVDTTPEIQALVNAYKAVLAAADGQSGNGAKLTQAQYELLGVSGISTPSSENLLGQVIDGKLKADVDTVGELQKLADAVAAVMAAVAGGTGPSLEQLQALGVTGLTPFNFPAMLAAIRETADDGTGADSLPELQALVTQAQAIKPPVATTGLAAITEAAQNDNATEGKPSVTDYTAAQVTGVDAGNLAAINSALNTADVTGEKANTKEEVQELVNAYAKVLAAADGKDDNDAKPTAPEFTLLGITGMDTAPELSLLGDVLDIKTPADVDRVAELQKLADAVAAVIAGAGPNTPAPTLEQLQALGLTSVNPANLAAVQAAIRNTNDDGTGVDSLGELQSLINSVNTALDVISGAAQTNTATEASPSADDYAKAGVKGVTNDNLAAINSALNSPNVDGGAVDTTPEIQALVDAYKAVLAAADGEPGNPLQFTQDHYELLGVSGVDNPQKVSLLAQVIDAKPSAAVDTVPELQKLADAVAAVMAAAAGGTGPSLEQLQDLGVTGVNPNNLAEVQKAIRETADDGTGVDNLSELQALVTQAQAIKPPVATTGLAAITEAAQNDNATEGKPSVTDYTAAQVTGVDAGNLAAINSALNTAGVTGEKANTKEEVQELVNAYAKVLAAADGKDDNDAKPTAPEFTLLGITGMDTAPELSLLGDVLDIKTPADVDRVAELQKLADAVAAVIAGAGPNTPAPSLEQLQALGLTGVNPANLAAVQAAIRGTDDTGTGVDTLPKLQALVTGIGVAFSAISAAAEANNATDTSPSAADYAKAGVTGVDAANLPAINSALNTEGVKGANVDTAPEIQALVDAYKAVLAAADGNADNDSKPTAAQYASLGVTGVNTPQKEALLGQVIDAKPSAAVDTVPELQKLADAVAAVMAAAAGGTGPSLEQLEELGLTGLTPLNVPAMQAAIRDTANDGSGVDSLGELQALVARAQISVPPVTASGLAAIIQAAQTDNATEGKPTLEDYRNGGGIGRPGVSGVNADNLAAINSVLNTSLVTGEKVDSVPEIQALVDAYNKVLNAADATDNNNAKPTAPEFTLLGITGMDTAPELSLLGDVLDIKTPADVDRVAELQKLADAVAAVIAGAGPNTPAPSLEQLQALGLTGVNPANLAAVQAAIRGTDDTGTGVDTLPKLQALVTGIGVAFSAISAAAEANNATDTSPSAADYAKAGVTGVDAANLPAINSALNTEGVKGANVDTAPEIQALVDAYKAVLAAADGNADNDSKPTAAQYASLGVTGVNTPQKEALLGQVIDAKPSAAVDTVPELQKLADAVAAVMAAAAGGTGPSLEQLQDLGVTGVNPNNLEEVQKGIRGTADDGTGVDNLSELQALVTQAQAIKPPVATTGLAAITEAAQNDNATEGKPSVTDYTAAQVTGVDAGNLAAINSALNTAGVTGEKANTKEEVQELVNAYAKVLAAADGKDDNDAKPTAPEFTLLGITGMDTAPELSLLGDVLDIKTPADVDRVAELQKLADAVAAVIAGAGPNTPAPSLEQLQALGLTGVNPANLAAVQAAIRGTDDTGTGVDTLPKLQALVTGIGVAFSAISAAAEANNATDTSPSAADYAKAGVTGVDAANLPAINSALNTEGVKGANVDTAPEIQALVDAYKAVLAAADGNADNDSKPTAAQYASLGVTGVNTPQKEALLGQVIDAKPSAAVDTVPELQKLADAVAAVMAAAAGGTGPSLEQLQELGVADLGSSSLPTLLAAIALTNDDGSQVDTLEEIQALVTQVNAIPPAGAPVFNVNPISRAAQANDATATTPSVQSYLDLGITTPSAELAALLGPLSTALNTAKVDGPAADTLLEVQALVNAYKKILDDAGGGDTVTEGAGPTEQQFALIGLNGVNSDSKTKLLGDVIDLKEDEDVNTVSKLQVLADAVAAVMSGAAGGTGPSSSQLNSLGLGDITASITPANLPDVLKAIADTDNTGAQVDTLIELRNLIKSVLAPKALDTISLAAQDNNASPSLTPVLNLGLSAAVFEAAGVTGVNAINLPSIQSVLDSAAITGEKANELTEVQALVDAYQAILTLADGASSPNAAKPTDAQYAAIGLSGINDPDEVSLLGSVLDLKTKAAVDEVTEVQALATIVDKLMALAAQPTGSTLVSPGLTVRELEALGLTGLSSANLAPVLEAIRDSIDTGFDVNTLPKLQTLVTSNSNTSVDIISAIAQANTASATNPSLENYLAAGVTGVGTNLAAINSILNAEAVGRAQTNTAKKIQDIVDAYKAVFDVADGQDNNDSDNKKPTLEQFNLLGLELETAAEAALLADVIDSKSSNAVNTLDKLFDLADAVFSVLAGTNSAEVAPSATDYSLLGLTGVTSNNLAAVNAALLNTNDTGAQVDSLPKLQALINITLISQAAGINDAVTSNFSPRTFSDAGVTGVDAGNLPAILSALDSNPVTADKTNEVGEIQALVNAYRAILSFANGSTPDLAIKPTQEQYTAIGVTGITDADEVNLLGDIIGKKVAADVDRISKIQSLDTLVDQILALAALATPASVPADISNALSATALESLGLTGVSAVNLGQLLGKIKATDDTGVEVNTLPKLQKLVGEVAIDTISSAAQNNTATPNPATQSLGLPEGIFQAAGVTGVDALNLPSIRSALDSLPVDADKTNTREEIQAVVDAYQAILNFANGSTPDLPTKPTQEQYAAIGVTGINDPDEVSLLGDVVGKKVFESIDTVSEIQPLAAVVEKIMALATQEPSYSIPTDYLTVEELRSLGLANLSSVNLPSVLQAIRNSANTGADVNTLPKIQALIGNNNNAGINAISVAAEGNNASDSSPSLADYGTAGVSLVDGTNLASINSALNTAAVDGAATDEAGKIQALVDAYLAILSIADGINDDNNSLPSKAQFDAIGITSVSTAQEVKLLGDVIDSKPQAAVDRVSEIKSLADAVIAVLKSAGPDNSQNPAAAEDQLRLLGLTGMDSTNIGAIQAAIRNTNDTGADIDTLPNLQALINIVRISEAAQTDRATPAIGVAGLSAIDFTSAGVDFVDSGNLASINSALDSALVTGEKTNTKGEIQALVNAYKAIFDFAGNSISTAPTGAQYDAIGVPGMDPANVDTEEVALLGDVIDRKTAVDVDRVGEIQELAATVDTVMALAALASPTAATTELSQSELTKLGLTNVTAVDFAKLKEAIRDTDNSGTGVQTVAQLQALIKAVAINTISQAAGDLQNPGNASSSGNLNAALAKPLFDAAGVTGVTNENVASINSALDSAAVTGTLTDTDAKIQAVINAYQAVLDFANGTAADVGTKPTVEQYGAIGVTGISDSNEANLLGDVIGKKVFADVDLVTDIQPLATTVDAVRQLAELGAGDPIPSSISNLLTKPALDALGLTGVTNNNLATVLGNIRADDVTGVNSFTGLQAKVPSDSSPPTIVSVQLESATRAQGSGFNKVIDEGDSIYVSVTMNEAVVVTGLPSIGLLLDGVSRTAIFDSVEGNKILFKYNVVNSDFDSDGVAIAQNSLLLNSGTIKDVSGLDATSLAFSSVSANKDYLVDAIDLGVGNGQLIKGTQAEGNWYFVWNRDGSPSHGGTSDQMNWATANSLNGRTVSSGAESINLTIPGYGLPSFTSGFKPGTTVADGTTANPTYDGLLALWDANNGSGTTAAVSGGVLKGNPPGWADGAVWSSLSTVAGQHVVVGLSNGGTFSFSDNNIYFAAYQVL